jgi:hypothetical protein
MQTGDRAGLHEAMGKMTSGVTATEELLKTWEEVRSTEDAWCVPCGEPRGAHPSGRCAGAMVVHALTCDACAACGLTRRTGHLPSATSVYRVLAAYDAKEKTKVVLRGHGVGGYAAMVQQLQDNEIAFAVCPFYMVRARRVGAPRRRIACCYAGAASSCLSVRVHPLASVVLGPGSQAAAC